MEVTTLTKRDDISLVILITTLILFVILLLFFVFVWVLAVKSQTPRRKEIDRLPELPYENVSWQVGSNGQTIVGWFIPPPHAPEAGRPGPAIVIAHGWSSTRASMLRYVPRLHAAGYALLLYDARSHGESDSVRATSGVTMRDDLRAALDYISKRLDVDRKRIGVLGHSLGAFASVLAVGGGEHRIKALVTDAMPAQLITMISAELTRRRFPLFPFVQLIPLVWWLRTGVPRNQYDPIIAINNTSAPILMIHSRGDDFIPWTELDYILKRITHKVGHLYVNSKGHSSSWQEEAYWENVLAFFNKRLLDAPSHDKAEAVLDHFEI